MFLPDVAQTLYNLALLDSDQNQTEAARKEYEEALKLCRELAKNNPEGYLEHVADILNKRRSS